MGEGKENTGSQSIHKCMEICKIEVHLYSPLWDLPWVWRRLDRPPLVTISELGNLWKAGQKLGFGQTGFGIATLRGSGLGICAST